VFVWANFKSFGGLKNKTVSALILIVDEIGCACYVAQKPVDAAAPVLALAVVRRNSVAEDQL